MNRCWAQSWSRRVRVSALRVFLFLIPLFLISQFLIPRSWAQNPHLFPDHVPQAVVANPLLKEPGVGSQNYHPPRLSTATPT
jgi:hypothetical protein